MIPIFYRGDVGRVVKNGRTYPVQPFRDRLFVKQRNKIVRRTYDLGRVVKLFFRKIYRVIDTFACQ